ncbi:hypothetical protein AC579_65 [Pseudocercospora musae]|uniref:F-box domain-containing protein n=1 Tax=Pseudocercospora musae TaxID=113226 RepID=A0A139IAE3_9PEZI|nr:hypothetical protein AC579_65 [Pseudocercospora musae]
MHPPTIFKDLPSEERHRRTPVELEYYMLGGHKTGQELGRFAKRCDLTKLRELHLERLVLPDDIGSLLHLNIRFPALLALSLGTAANNPQIDSQAAKFIRTIPPLRALRMTIGTGRLALNAILETHGESLRSLNLGTSELGYISDYIDVASPSTIKLRAKRCPNISYLDITIPHIAGDERELEMFTALGSMPRLQYLMLSLAFEHYNTDGPERGEYIEREDLQGLERRTTHSE